MDALQQTLDHELANLPRRFFEGLLLKKLRAAGIPATSTLLDKLVTHILSGNNEPFVYKHSKRRTADLNVTDADLNEMTSALDSFCEKQLPTLVDSLADSISKQLLKHLKSSWADEHALQQADFSEFRERLEGRWGTPLGQLRMLLTISREWCQESNNSERRPKAAKTLHLKKVLTRLLVRACQVTDEIIW
jgi:hypothetical protein